MRTAASAVLAATLLTAGLTHGKADLAIGLSGGGVLQRGAFLD
ncbi:hypothetical protein SRB17_40360 [Streptomyces sp. RB17]|nr:hypothetical protein [Streptomyces sp. RB17]MQY36039.1 hypothetical protein [Streptomyces sp. RB17]